jgi:hypothetical protein
LNTETKYRPSPTLDWGVTVIHRGIQYTVAATVEPDLWQWQFQIGESVKTGKTKTRLAALAARRVQLKIDAALKASSASSATRGDNRANPQNSQRSPVAT